MTASGIYKVRHIRSRYEAAAYITRLLGDKLDSGQSVLWLVSGGSSIKVAVDTANAIRLSPALGNLTICLADERYGHPGHPDSNWAALEKAGFKLQGYKKYAVINGSIGQSSKLFNDFLNAKLSEDLYKIGLFGMGTDGHTAGILPGSRAVAANSLATHYKAGDFSRITITPRAISKLDEAVLYTEGDEKLSVLNKLGNSAAIDAFPVMALRSAAKLSIYNARKE